MKKIRFAIVCAAMLLGLTACGKREENGMIKPEIRIGETSVTLLCTLKDIDGVSIEKIYETDFDAYMVDLSYNGERIAKVDIYDPNKDIPLDEKTVFHISTSSNQVDFYGIQCKKSTFDDVDAVFGIPEIKDETHCAIPLGDDFFVEFWGDSENKMIYEIELYKYNYFPQSSDADLL